MKQKYTFDLTNKKFSITHFPKTHTALFLALWLFAPYVVPSLSIASLSPSKTNTPIISMNREADLQVLRQALESKVLVQKLKDYGLTKDQIEKKISQMTDGEIHQIALVSKKRPGGGKSPLDTWNAFWALLFVVILIVALISVFSKPPNAKSNT